MSEQTADGSRSRCPGSGQDGIRWPWHRPSLKWRCTNGFTFETIKQVDAGVCRGPQEEQADDGQGMTAGQKSYVRSTLWMMRSPEALFSGIRISSLRWQLNTREGC